MRGDREGGRPHPGGMCLPGGCVADPVGPISPPPPLLQRPVWSQPSPPRYLTALGADLLSVGLGWLRPQRGPRGDGGCCVAAGGVEGAPQTPLLSGGRWRWTRHQAPPSVYLSIHPLVVLWLDPGVSQQLGQGLIRQLWSQEVAPPFSIPVVEPAPESGDRHGGRGACPPAPGHHTTQAWREGLDVAQISRKGSASGSSAQAGASGWRGTPAPPWGPSLRPPTSPLLTVRGGLWWGRPSSGRCRWRGRARQLPAAGPGGSAAAPPGQPPVPPPAASAGGERRGEGSAARR